MTITNKKIEFFYQDNLDSLHSFYLSAEAILKGLNKTKQNSLKENFAVRYFHSLYCKLSITLKSIAGNPICTSNEKIRFFELSTFASLTRLILDIYLHFYFYVAGAENKEEFNYLHLVSSYLSDHKRLEILKSGALNSDLIQSMEETVNSIKEKLLVNPIFSSHNEKIIKNILNGNISDIYNQKEIAFNAGIPNKYYSSLWKFLSNHSHMTPYAFSQLLVYDPKNEESRITLSIVFEYTLIISSLFFWQFNKIIKGTDLYWHERTRKEIEHWRNFMARQKINEEKN